jgi:hypothetical protein
MPKKLLATILILTTILALVVSLQVVEVADANPYMFLRFTRIQIHSPQSHVYVCPNVDLSFDYYVETNLPQVDSFSYSLDGKANSTLVGSKSSILHFIKYSVFKTLENLSNDNHKLIVYAHFSNNTVFSILDQKIVVDTAYIQPTPFMISPLNQTTYNTREIDVAYTIDAKIFYYRYDLDDRYNRYYDSSKSINANDNGTLTNVGLVGNTTLTNLSDGSHKLKLILTIQPYERYYSETCFITVYFNVDSDEPSPSLTPNTTALMPTVNSSAYAALFVSYFQFIIRLIAIAIVLIIVLLVYFKRKRGKP